MAQPPPSATPSDTKAWGRETWVDRMASLSNFREPSPTATTSSQPPHVHAPHVKHTLHPLHHPLPRTNWPPGGTGHRLPPPRRLRPPPGHNPGPDTYTREDEPDDPHIWGTWERRSLDTLFFIRSRHQDLGKASYCLDKWTQRTCEIPTDRWLWKVTLRPQHTKAPPNRGRPASPRPTTLQLCPYMVAARLMALLSPRPDDPTQYYRHLMEEDMPGIQRCLFKTLDYLQQTHPHVLELRWTPPDNPRTCTAETTPRHRHVHVHQNRHARRSPGKARAHTRCPSPHPHPHY